MTSPIELYVQCVELLESIHNQIESEKKKLNIVGTDNYFIQCFDLK